MVEVSRKSRTNSILLKTSSRANLQKLINGSEILFMSDFMLLITWFPVCNWLTAPVWQGPSSCGDTPTHAVLVFASICWRAPIGPCWLGWPPIGPWYTLHLCQLAGLEVDQFLGKGSFVKCWSIGRELPSQTTCQSNWNKTFQKHSKRFYQIIFQAVQCPLEFVLVIWNGNLSN